MKARDLLEFVLLGAIWGASFPFMRIAAPEMGPLFLIEIRVLLGGLFLLAIVMTSDRISQWKEHWRWIAVIGALNSAVPFTLFAYATLTLPAGFTSVLNATAPLFGTMIGALWFRDRLTWQRILGLLLGFVGVVVLVSGKLSLSGSWTAIGAGLSAAIMYGFAAHMTKRYLSQVDPMVIAAGSSLSASLLLAPIALGAIPSTMPSISSWIAVAVLGLLCTGIAYFIYFRLLRRIGPGPSMTVAYLIPMFGVLWGGLFLSEPITWNLVVGGGLVLSGVYVMVRGTRTDSPAK